MKGVTVVCSRKLTHALVSILYPKVSSTQKTFMINLKNPQFRTILTNS